MNYVTSFIFSNALVGFCLMLVFFYFGSLVRDTCYQTSYTVLLYMLLSISLDLFSQIFQVVVFLLIADYPDTAETLNYIFLLHPAYA